MELNPVKILDTFKIPATGFLFVAFGVLLWILYAQIPVYVSPALKVILFFMPILVPIILAKVFWNLWLEYIRAKFIHAQEYTLLEIRLPREILRSPLAMDTLLTNLHIGPGEGTFINRYIEGKVRPWFSLEMVSLGGQIHFYIWTRKALKNLVEAQIYGQYPMVEVHEVDDYAQKVQYRPGQMSVWGCDFKLSKPDPYPIKTYIDYGLDKDPKEEFKIDPMGGFFEFLASVGPGEQIWLQLMIRVNKDDLKENRKFVYKGGLTGSTTSWKEEAAEEIKKIVKEATIKTVDQKNPTTLNLSKGQQDVVAALERSISKYGFDAGIRGIYIAEKDKFNAVNISALTASLKQLGSLNLNGFVPTRWFTQFDYPWQDWRGKKQEKMRSAIIEAYKRRSWFHPPFKTPSFVLNTEEVATIFHFPGAVVQAPTLGRIPSTKGEAPPNLPV